MPANTPIELSLGDTDNRRLCPALTNSSLSPLRINGGRRSNCTVISAKQERNGLEVSSNSWGLCSVELFLFASRKRLNSPRGRGIELPRVISADHFHFCCSSSGPHTSGRKCRVGTLSHKFTPNGRNSVWNCACGFTDEPDNLAHDPGFVITLPISPRIWPIAFSTLHN